MTILQGSKRFIENEFKLEEDFEELVRSQSKILFGKDTIIGNEPKYFEELFAQALLLDGGLAGVSAAAGCQPAIQPISNRRYMVGGRPEAEIVRLMAGRTEGKA